MTSSAKRKERQGGFTLTLTLTLTPYFIDGWGEG